MAQILIRKLDDAVVETLRKRARAKGHSLEQEARGVLAGAAALSVEEKLALVDGIRVKTRPVRRPASEDLIRRDRDAR